MAKKNKKRSKQPRPSSKTRPDDDEEEEEGQTTHNNTESSQDVEIISNGEGEDGPIEEKAADGTDASERVESNHSAATTTLDIDVQQRVHSPACTRDDKYVYSETGTDHAETISTDTLVTDCPIHAEVQPHSETPPTTTTTESLSTAPALSSSPPLSLQPNPVETEMMNDGDFDDESDELSMLEQQQQQLQQRRSQDQHLAVPTTTNREDADEYDNDSDDESHGRIFNALSVSDHFSMGHFGDGREAMIRNTSTAIDNHQPELLHSSGGDSAPSRPQRVGGQHPSRIIQDIDSDDDVEVDALETQSTNSRNSSRGSDQDNTTYHDVFSMAGAIINTNTGGTPILPGSALPSIDSQEELGSTTTTTTPTTTTTSSPDTPATGNENEPDGQTDSAQQEMIGGDTNLGAATAQRLYPSLSPVVEEDGNPNDDIFLIELAHDAAALAALANAMRTGINIDGGGSHVI